MSNSDRPDVTPAPVEPGAETGAETGAVVSAGWLAQNSVFERPDDRRIGRAMISSLALHAAMAVAILWLLAIRPEARPIRVDPPDTSRIVFLERLPGPGGGGGGSPAPAPPKPIEIPKHKVPDPVPIVPPTPVPVPPPPPPPTLDAPVVTNMASVMQAAGQSSISIADLGGGGRGRGIGQGRGPGVGPGEGGGFGGNARAPGAGISDPELLKRVDPTYTNDAMRARIQGMVILEAVVLANGTVGDVRVVRSLDPGAGLDQEAMKAARRWLFRPSRDRQGNAVPVIVRLELEFTLR